MTAPKPRYTPDPRYWNEFQVAARLDKGLQWFQRHKATLEAEGFPRKDSLLGGWDSKAIEMWMDERSGLDLPSNTAEAQALKALRARAS
jgi:hypothetical protein